MPDTIKQRIALDGDSEVKKSLAEIGDVGERSFKKIDDASKQAAASIGALTKDRLSKIGISPEEFNKRTEAFKAQPGGSPPPGGPPPEGPPHGPRDSAEAIHRLREVLHVLHPVLAEAGIGFGELSGFMVAARGGAVALAASIGGALVTALEKAGDEANDAAARLGAFAGSTEKGREAFHQLQGTAEQLRVPTGDLTSPFEQLLRANQSSPAGAQASDKGLQDTLATFVKGSQADRTDFTKAIGGITEFFASLKENGRLTPDAAKKLEEVAPRFAAQLLDDLSKRLPGKPIYSTQDVVQSTANVAPQVDANFLKSQKDAVESIDAAWLDFKGAADKLKESVGAGSGIASTLGYTADFMRSLAGFVKSSKEEYEKLTSDLRGGAGTSNQAGRLNAAFDAIPEAPAGATEKLKSSFEALNPAVDNAQKVFDEFAKKAGGDIELIAAHLSKQQTEIDKKFEPKEAANRLAKDQLSIANADIHLQQAKISGFEANKNKEIAGLAPETARENLADAAANRDNALANFLRNRGVDTSALEAANAQGADSRALDRAETALKRAQIEQKYAYLEPQKADLAAQQTETAIRSAEIEKNDAGLRFAKDREQAPISHDLQQLKYSEALLKEAELQTKYGEKTVGKLDDILQALSKNAEKRDSENARTDSGERAAQGGSIGNEQTAGDQVRPIQPDGSKLLDNGVVNIPRGASQDTINDALKQQAAPSGPRTKQELQKEFDGQIQELKRDWKSQSDFNEQIGKQNGGVQKLGPDEFNPSYLPPVSGHYDPRTQQFIAPGNNNYDFAPKNNDYQFGGQTNPAGRYQPGISAPLSFPDYNKQLMDSLPDAVPLPQPRPPEADQQSALQQPQQVADLGDAISKIVQAISAAANQASDRAKLDQGGQPSSGLGIRGEAEPTEAPKELSELGDDAGAAGDKLGRLGDAVDSVVARLNAAQPSDSGGSVGAATGGLIHAASGGHIVDATGGGHLQGPGTGTSDSIPAMVSNEEFVVNAKDTAKNLPLLRSINAGHYADGGFVDHLTRMGFADGGTIDVPHLAVGGIPHMVSAQQMSKSVMQGANTERIPVDLRTDHGTVRADVDRDGLGQLRRAAVMRNIGKDKQPSWVAG